MSTARESTDPVRVLIAIQARSNSTRFPGKIFESIGKKPILVHVIDKATSAKIHLEKPNHKVPALVDVAVLHPKGDTKILDFFKTSSIARRTGIMLMHSEGDESDVLSRYVTAQRRTDADYVVRITSDCPFIPDFIISKHVNTVLFNYGLDYVSNVEESCRQAADGFDCEVISKKAIRWLEENATTPEEKEHVTIAIRQRRPKEIEQAFVSSKVPNFGLKLSVDTPEDLQRLREWYHSREATMNEAYRLFGRNNIFEL